MMSLKTSLRNTGWSMHTPNINLMNLSKSDILPEPLYHSRSRFSTADGKRRSFLKWKNLRLFHWSKENKSWPELLHWSVEDFLTVWMSSTLSEQWLWIPARQCPLTSGKCDATVTTEHSRLHSCWWMGIIFSRSGSVRLLHWDILQEVVTKADDFRLQIYRTSNRQSKTNGRMSPLIRTFIAQWKKTECG